MIWYHILGLYAAVVLGLAVLLLATAKGLYRRHSSRNGRGEVRHSLLVKVWRWVRFVARCGRRRKKRAKPTDNRREERRALRKQLREEAEEWLTEWLEKIVELGEDLLDADFDDEDEDDDYYLNGDQGSSDETGDERQVVIGLVNTGNSCFFNSVLQALASSECLQGYLSTILERMDEINDLYDGNMVSMPLTEALWETLTDLNAVVNRDSAFQPYAVMAALGSSRLNDREQQDAQEAFQLISTALSDERQVFADLQIPSLLNPGLVGILASADVQKPHVFAVPPGLESVGAKGLARVRALMKLASLADRPTEGQVLTFGRRPVMQNPFTGLMANRLSCAQCGYTEAVRHVAFDNVLLSLPLAASCTLDQALREYVALEELTGVECRKCTLSLTLRNLISDIRFATNWLAENPRYSADKHSSDAECDSANASLGSAKQRARARRRADRAESVWRRAVLNHESKDGNRETYDSDSDSDSGLDSDVNSASDTHEKGDVDGRYTRNHSHNMAEYPLDPSKQQIDRKNNLPPPSLVNVPQIVKRLRESADKVAKALRFDVQCPLPGITLHKAYSPLRTKQIAFAKLPPCLCLHLSRSAITPDGYVVKNPCHVRFPEYLDVSLYTTSGNLKVNPKESIIDEQAHPDSNVQLSRRAKDAADALGQTIDPQFVYRLQAVVVHIGSHSYGHFITYRRKPQPPTRSGVNTPRYRSSSSVSLSHYNTTTAGMQPLDKRQTMSTTPMPAETADGLRRRRIVGGSSNDRDLSDSSGIDSVLPSGPSVGSARPKRSWRVADAMTAEWYLISDEDVQAVTLPEVLNANPYLLIYERVDGPPMTGYSGSSNIIPSLSNLRNLARRSASAQSAPQTTTATSEAVDAAENGGLSSPAMLAQDPTFENEKAPPLSSTPPRLVQIQ
ncbi:ubiquitin-specific protease ubp1 [Coemansia sp. RSA 1813]|nr:ubiquitin-specific protease ubp1 [Coemansia sp. RSA 1646]KAJ1772881.1 ubiquitin-specific protease ubp1 [Coemansia sp. RSA 1843]KAJ2093454.1 ubiquitin-specific protease ubp1 [Coemansia sp. RSA 986]KAJ2217262.1 ubiquitin-specific protease ubp1 [Coemansia sp. RSA 487]KAJ2572462.1 ubiquitin-specific protease ubp1 [Coemansia sp. RSA 1813]